MFLYIYFYLPMCALIFVFINGFSSIRFNPLSMIKCAGKVTLIVHSVRYAESVRLAPACVFHRNRLYLYPKKNGTNTISSSLEPYVLRLVVERSSTYLKQTPRSFAADCPIQIIFKTFTFTIACYVVVYLTLRGFQ